MLSPFLVSVRFPGNTARAATIRRRKGGENECGYHSEHAASPFIVSARFLNNTARAAAVCFVLEFRVEGKGGRRAREGVQYTSLITQ